MTAATSGFRVGGRYELTEPIATGGMAQVWRALDTILDRPVAVKILHPHLATDAGFLVRFRREAVAAARLSHPGIVAIYDTVSADGLEAIVMELIDGRTLRMVLDETPMLSPSDTTIVGVQVADALAEAHRGGVVHRDIKPSNVLLCSDRRVMVTDFGIAKAGEDTDLTVTGTLLGTAKYLSPEQVRGEDVDPRSDLYSLGVVLFEALAGQPPFKAETDAATALARLHSDAPPLQQFRPDVPADLAEIVMRLLARDPDHRFARAVDLRAVLDGSGTQAAAPPIGQTTVADSPASEPTVPLATAPPTQPLSPTNTSTPGANLDHPATSGPALQSARQDAAVGVDPTPSEPNNDDHSFVHSERSWLVPALVVVLLAGALLVAAILISRGVTDGSTSADPDRDSEDSVPIDDVESTATTPLSNIQEVEEASIVSATSFDPEGDDQEENQRLVPNAFDGDDQTSWRTTTYRSANFGRLKSGVGLLLSMGGLATVSEVEFSTPTIAWSVEIYVGDDFSGPPDTWGEPVATARYLGQEDVDLDFPDVEGTTVLFWITDHGLSDDRDDEPGPDHRFELLEIQVS